MLRPNFSITLIPLIDPLRRINSYNHGLTNNDNSKSNDYHYKDSYEYEPGNKNHGLNDWKGKCTNNKRKIKNYKISLRQ